MDNLETLMIKKITTMQRIKKIDAKSEEAQNRKEAPLRAKLAIIEAELKEEIQKQKQIVESINNLNDSVNDIIRHNGVESAVYRLEERAIDARGINNKEVAKFVLTTMKKQLSFRVSFNKAYGIEDVCDARDFGKVEEKLALLGV